MNIRDNIALINEIEECLDGALPVRLGVNKRNELVRLMFEIALSGDLSVDEVMERSGLERIAAGGRNGLFGKAKKELMRMRYPGAEPGMDPHIMPVKIRAGSAGCDAWSGVLEPENIFIENDVREEPWTERFTARFPGVRPVHVDSISETPELRGTDKEKSYERRRRNIFIVRNRAAFIKRCPCTRGAQRCGYWVLNLGFGCPMDCSYCYLEQYSNAPGLILPANIREYRSCVRDFDSRVVNRTRIGTGEFTDSLALDRYTGYSSDLVEMFRGAKNLVLELKTKAADISGVLRQRPHDNVVVSWSVNTPRMSGKYEKGGAPMTERVKAARSAARRGFNIGFHFDPIIYYPGWEKEYSDIVREIFDTPVIRSKCVWISLGTLRYTPGLKQAAENRFADNGLFYYGEFFRGFDGKMRYPEQLRKKMYKELMKNIERADASGWVYLCMEEPRIWKELSVKRPEYCF
jgi:spore photoproduct lyase